MEPASSSGVRAYARETGAEVTAVVNVGDDVIMHGLRICPDLDSVMYTLGGGADPERGWGRVGETWTIKDELAAYGAEPTWFGLGDKDIATHLVRTTMLNAGYPLSAVTEALCARWQPGVRMLPATDDRLETHVVVDAPTIGRRRRRRGQRAIHFQEWWVRYRGDLPTHRFVFVGAEAAKPAAGVLDALAGADVVLVAPSNPVVSIAPILAVPGLREALTGGPAPVIGVSPIIGGRAGTRHGRPLPGGARRAVHRGRGGRAVRGPRRRRDPRRLAGGHDGRGHDGAGADRPGRSALDDRRGRDRGDGPGRGGAGMNVSLEWA